MEYYNVSSGTDGLSLQDMIECDIKTNIDELMKSTGTNISDHVHGLENLDSGNQRLTGFHVSDADIKVHANFVNSSNSIGDLGLLPNLEPQTLDWLNSVDVHNLNDISPVGAENTNPNLLVNPQTGMPIQTTHQLAAQQQPSPSAVRTPTLQSGQSHVGFPQTTQANANPTAQPKLIQNFGHIQLINIPTSALRQQSFIPVQTLQSGVSQQPPTHFQTLHQQITVKQHIKSAAKSHEEKTFPKPVYSYSCLIAMALKNSRNGSLPVSEIYNFMTQNFPYFKTAPDGWKNSVRHNLSLNKCFEKIENPKGQGNSTRKGCLWAMNPAKIEKMEEEIAKWRKKDPLAIKRSMAKPDELDKLEKGLKGTPSEPKDQEPVTLSITETEEKGGKDIILGDINILDPNLSDLNDLNLQQTLLHEFCNDDIQELNIDSLPPAASPLLTTSGKLQIVSSQLSTPTKVSSESNSTSIQGSYVYTPVSYAQVDHNTLVNQTHQQYFYNGSARTVAAQT